MSGMGEGYLSICTSTLKGIIQFISNWRNIDVFNLILTVLWSILKFESKSFVVYPGLIPAMLCILVSIPAVLCILVLIPAVLCILVPITAVFCISWSLFQPCFVSRTLSQPYSVIKVISKVNNSHLSEHYISIVFIIQVVCLPTMLHCLFFSMFLFLDSLLLL